jgi:hypothetical protein
MCTKQHFEPARGCDNNQPFKHAVPQGRRCQDWNGRPKDTELRIHAANTRLRACRLNVKNYCSS